MLHILENFLLSGVLTIRLSHLSGLPVSPATFVAPFTSNDFLLVTRHVRHESNVSSRDYYIWDEIIQRQDQMLQENSL